MQLEVFLRARFGIARYATLTANGFTRRQIEDAVHTGQVSRVGRGIFALPATDPDVVLAACSGASLTCISAARVLGWWVLPSGTPTMTTTPTTTTPTTTTAHLRCDRALTVPGAVVHRGQRSAHRLIAPPQQILRDAFRCLPLLDALVMAEYAVVTNAVGLRSLQAQFRGQRDWQVRALLGTIRRTTASPLEVCARFHLLNAGLGVETEAALPGIGRVDLLVDGWLIIEIDGFAFHSTREHYRADRRRWNTSTAGGWITLRITAELILHHPDEFVALVQKTRNTWRGRVQAPAPGQAGNSSRNNAGQPSTGDVADRSAG